MVLSLASAAFYGAGDFCGGLASKRVAVLTVTVLSQCAGFVLLLLALPWTSSHPIPSDVAWGAAAGVCGGFGIALLYHALSIGKMGVVSPVTAVLAALTPLTVALLRGERLAPVQVAGLGLAVVAIAFISFSLQRDGDDGSSTWIGLREAIFSGVVIGGFFACIAQVHATAGMGALAVARGTSIALLILVAVRSKVTLWTREPGMLRLIVGGGIVDQLANVLFVIAAYRGLLSVAAVLSSLYPASTVFLARIVLGERLARSQQFGVALALAGVVCIAW